MAGPDRPGDVGRLLDVNAAFRKVAEAWAADHALLDTVGALTDEEMEALPSYLVSLIQTYACLEQVIGEAITGFNKALIARAERED